MGERNNLLEIADQNEDATQLTFMGMYHFIFNGISLGAAKLKVITSVFKSISTA